MKLRVPTVAHWWSNQILLVAYTYLADVIAGVAKWRECNVQYQGFSGSKLGLGGGRGGDVAMGVANSAVAHKIFQF